MLKFVHELQTQRGSRFMSEEKLLKPDIVLQVLLLTLQDKHYTLDFKVNMVCCHGGNPNSTFLLNHNTKTSCECLNH